MVQKKRVHYKVRCSKHETSLDKDKQHESFLDRVVTDSPKPVFADEKEPVSSSRQGTWSQTVEAFSAQDGKMYSPAFLIGGFRWRFLVYPKGFKLDDYVSAYVVCRGPSRLAKKRKQSRTWSQSASFKVIVVSALGDEYNLAQESSHRFAEAESIKGFQKFVPWSLLSDRSRGFMLDDNITFRAEITLQDDQYDLRKNTRCAEIKQVTEVAEDSEQVRDPSRAAELKSKLGMPEANVKEMEPSLTEDKDASEKSLVHNEVTEDDSASTVGASTRISVTNPMSSETEKLLTLDDTLGKRVIGQKEAVKAVAEAVQRSRAGLSNPKQPIASLAFLGPTGVGKTELAKALAEQLFDSDGALIRLDMNAYMEKVNVSSLVGVPPEYVGSDDGGHLSEAVRRRPYSVVLFEEIEKAHPDVFNILLQVLDNGRITDSHGHVVDFTNTVIILTSHTGSGAILGLSSGDSQYEGMREKVMSVMRGRLLREFVSRVDEFIIFHSLGEKELEKIVDMRVAEVNTRIADKKLMVKLTDKARKLLGKLGYDPVYGARPLKRVVQKELETRVAKGILEGKFRSGDIIDVTSHEDAFELEVHRDAFVAEDEE